MSTTAKSLIAVAAVVVLAVAFWLIRPLFVDTVVDEEFPVSSSATEDGDAAGGTAGEDEAFPLSAGAEVPDDMTQEEVEAEMEAAAAAPDVEEVEDMPEGEPTVLSTGSFGGADSAHSGAGTATIYALADGSHVLRFEDFEVTNGPDLRVYLAPLDADGQPHVGEGAVELGRLKGNIGNQNYDIPADVDLSQPLGVVIYCQPFSVTFATAPLAA
ncbi:DM13 domain-containing protein [Euzebya sp.]|uniref:DM13 domain-containing protein n=1 Tax=Euzebya sp. TaxID=1971409 RepID=UPI0035199011